MQQSTEPWAAVRTKTHVLFQLSDWGTLTESIRKCPLSILCAKNVMPYPQIQIKEMALEPLLVAEQ